MSDRHEGDMIAHCMATARITKTAESCAILYRAHFQSRSLEEALIKRSIPYRIIGGVQFYERKEIKDILAYLKLIINPRDRISFFRVINCPARGLGEQFEMLFRDRWQDEPTVPFYQIGTHLIEQRVLTGVRRSAVEFFITLLEFFKPTDNPTVVAEHIIMKTGYFSYLTTSCEKEEALERQENCKELLRALRQFEQQGITTIAAFLDEVALMQEHASRDNVQNNPVLLMTIHAAKGLEFDMVAITGLEEGILPSSRSLTSQESIEEERRLCYVAITRAKNYLLISHCRYRYAYGQTNDQLRSRFIDEIPSGFAHIINCSDMSEYHAILLFQSWFRITQQKLIQKTAIPKEESRTRTVLHKPKTGKLVAVQPRFKKYQTVTHATFGTGIVQTIDTRDDGTVIVEVRFSSSTKKIAATFLTTV
jgi:DNA helicase-2/ATP-dependent DNA helicase PcrA